MAYRKFFTYLCLTALSAPPLLAYGATEALAQDRQGGVIAHVRVENNQRVEPSTVRTYLGITEGDRFDPVALDKGLKKLFATGFFADVTLLRVGNDLVVRVVENPSINKVVFEGNDRVETKDLEKEIEMKPRSIYTKAKVQADVKRILNIYRRGGRYTATVEPKLIQREQNRVDLVYEISEGPVARVAKISFIGNNHFSTSSLEEVIRTAEARWWRFLNDNDKYDPDRLEFDKELLRKFYTSQGYADFQVKSSQAELSPGKDAFYITFVLEEGPQYTLSSVEVKSELKGEEKPDFHHAITTKKGQVYDSGKVEESVDAITKELGNRGYAFVDVNPRLDRNTDKNTLALTYEIKPGPRVYVERINITGNVRTLDEVIRREFRLNEGDPYNAAKLARTEQRLNNLGFFQKVKITTEQGSAPDRTIIDVDVQEKSTGEINLGAGFSTADGPLADVGFKESNLLGRGQEIKANVVWAALRKDEEFGFTEPYFMGRELNAGFDLFHTVLNYDNYSNYDLKSTGFTLRGAYALREKLSHSFYYSLRDNDISNISDIASTYIKQQAGREVNSSIGHAIAWDDRNNKFDPTSGFYLKVSQELAGLGGDSKYLKHEVRTSYFIPEAKNWTFSVGGGAGYLYGLQGKNIYIADRFFLGGDLVRGFSNVGLGPHDTSTRDALGGNVYYAGSVEQKFPLGLPEDIGLLGAAFLDVGSLWHVDDHGANIGDSNKPRVSAGFGVAWASPFGPVRIDLAKPIIKEKFDDTELLRFSFGTRF